MSTYDLIVIGLGAAGSATLYQAAARGAKVLGLDRHTPPHDQGSSHGETRITRQGIGEGPEYAPLALRAHELWREIEAETGETLMRTTGALMISPPALGNLHHGKRNFLEQTIAVAQAFAIPHEVLDAEEVRRRWPQLGLADRELAYFEPGAGMLNPERCIRAQLNLAVQRGGEVHPNEPALAVETTGGGVRVTTAQGTYEAGRAVVAAGAWTGALLGGGLARTLTLYRQTLHWFEPDDPAAFAPERLPVFIWVYGPGEGDSFYGFPIAEPGTGVKIGSEQFVTASPAPEAIDRAATREEGLAVHARHIAGRINGLPAHVLRSKACIYTCAPESRFVIGPDGSRENVIVVSACSGHGFKHSASIGELVADWALSGSRPPLMAPFATPALVA